jgi:hypothetical protein
MATNARPFAWPGGKRIKSLAVLMIVFAVVASPGAFAQTGQWPPPQSTWSIPKSSTTAPAKPSKQCTRYGEGFYYVPGTDTCVKVTGEVRSDVSVSR